MEQFYPIIEAYLNKELEEAEKIAFEKECQLDNSPLAKAFAYYLSAQKAAEEARRDEFKKRYHQLENKKKQVPNNHRWLALAASILLIVTAFFLWRTSTSYTPETLADKYWQTSKIPEPINQMGENNDAEKQLSNAFKSFKSKNYTAALQSLTNISNNDELYSATLRLQGIIEYEQGEYDLAIQSFTEFLALNKGTKAEVLWFQALAFLKNQQLDKATANLDEIIQQNYSIAEDAKELKIAIQNLKSD